MPLRLNHVDENSVFPVLKPPRKSTLKTAVAAITSQRNKLVVSRTVTLILERPALFAFSSFLAFFIPTGI